MLTRSNAALVVGYVDRVVGEKDYSAPSEQKTLQALSTLLDQSMERVYQKAIQTLTKSDGFLRAIQEIERQPRVSGGFSLDNRILTAYTDFERMAALRAWINKHSNIRQVHTFSLATGPKDQPQYIPVYFRPPKKATSSSMHLMLGNASGALKAPKYQEWSINDPRGTAQEVFIDPLNALELVRQPSQIWAHNMRAAAFENGMRLEYRYKVYLDGGTFFPAASIEIPRQSSREVKEHKNRSAGVNLAALIKNDRSRDHNLLKPFHYEGYAEEGYHDDDVPSVTAMGLLNALPNAVKGDTRKLDRLSEHFVAARLGLSNLPQMRDLSMRMLFNIRSS